MCLGKPVSNEEKQAIIDAGKKRGYIRAWKMVKISKKRRYYLPPFFWHGLERYRPGLQAAWSGRRGGDWGWHCFLDEHSANDYQKQMSSIASAVIQCLAKPQWLRSAGQEHQGRGYPIRKTATFTHLVFPEYPKCTVTVKEFREAVKHD